MVALYIKLVMVSFFESRSFDIKQLPRSAKI